MALSTGSSITWSDISTILTSINAARNKFGVASATLTNGGQGQTAKSALVQELFSALTACNGKNAGQDGTVSVGSISIPPIGSLIKTVPLSSIYTEANRIKGLNFSFFSSFNPSFNPSFNSNFVFFASSFFSSFNQNFVFFSSFDSFNANFVFFRSFDGFDSNFDSNFNFVTTFRHGFHSSFNGSSFHSNFTFDGSSFDGSFHTNVNFVTTFRGTRNK